MSGSTVDTCFCHNKKEKDRNIENKEKGKNDVIDPKSHTTILQSQL